VCHNRVVGYESRKKMFLAKRERKNEMRFAIGIIVINANDGYGVLIRILLKQRHIITEIIILCKDQINYDYIVQYSRRLYCKTKNT